MGPSVVLAVVVMSGCAGEISGAGQVDGDGAPIGDVDGGNPGDLDGGVPASDELYAEDSFPRFDLELPAESIAALEGAPDQYARGTLRYGDEVVANIGVRLKGEYTFRPITQKASFKLKFDELVPGQMFRGLRRMTLNNGFEDPSLVAERLVYHAFRGAGLPAPRCNNAQVYVNGENYGIYVNIETEDKTFLRRWFASEDGNLYEELGSDWLPGNEYAFELETNETVNDRSDLTALFAAIAAAGDATLMSDVAAIVDTDRFLAYSAMEGIVNQWDGYAYTQFGPNNYRIYHDPATGHFSVLPWGMDMSMKPYGGNPYVDLGSPAGHLLARCVASASCLAAYRAVVTEQIDLFESFALDAVAEAAYAQIRAAVYADPRKEHSNATFDAAYGTVLDFVRDRPDAARAQLP